MKNIPWSLIIAKLKDELSAEEKLRLEQWMTSEKNRKIYEDLSEIWLGIQEQSMDYTPDKDLYWQKLHTHIQEEKKKEERSLRNRSFNKFRYVVAACAVLLLLLGGGTFWTIRQMQKQMQQEVRFSNLSGKSYVMLGDGTKVWLHSDTSLDYKREFSSVNREVKMTGEAYFEVAHDPKHPFVIQMEGMKLTVYGTKFNVRDIPHSNEVMVSLQEGSVGLETLRENYRMRPGEKAVFNKKTKILQINRGDVAFDISWAQKQIVFNQKSLGFICKYLANWYNVEIVLEPALKDKYLYTFTLRDEPLEEIMRLIARVNPVSYYFNEENKLFISSEKK